MAAKINFEGTPHAATRLFRKSLLAFAACVLSTTTSAEELFNVAQTSLGATAVVTGAPCNKDWPGLRAIPKEDPRIYEPYTIRSIGEISLMFYSVEPDTGKNVFYMFTLDDIYGVGPDGEIIVRP